ncbi:MAG TPA: transcription elongation factor GreA [Actinomycetota bacterium]|nr:transcription elongation factor GreA [Actinomycetota bacterium]
MVDDEKKTPLTKNAYERLKEELGFLEGEDRQRIISDIATARAHGDLSENAEYHAAKEEQGQKEARIRQIRQMLESAELVDDQVDDNIVRPGKLVTIRHPGEDPETYFLGLREEKGGDYDVLTPDSPLGQALIGRSAGETVVAKVPAGDLKVELVEVKTL